MPRERGSVRGYVYFLRAGNEVKIGFSTDLAQRLENLRNGNAFPVFMCLYVEGTRAKEREFHRRFAEYRLRGEWFDLRGSLARFLENHIYPVALPEKIKPMELEPSLLAMFQGFPRVQPLSLLQSDDGGCVMKKHCIAMAYRKRPLARIAVDQTDQLIYVLNPNLVDNGDSDDSGAVGFPREFVFEPDEKWLSDLETAFESGDGVRLDSLWRQGRPLAL